MGDECQNCNIGYLTFLEKITEFGLKHSSENINRVDLSEVVSETRELDFREIPQSS